MEDKILFNFIVEKKQDKYKNLRNYNQLGLK